MSDRTSTVLLRFGPMIYGPTVLFALGEGAVIPLIPIIAAQLGADVAIAALVASALVVGQLCGNIPAGWTVARLGERLTMAIAGTLSIIGVLGMVFAPSLGVFAASVFLIGFCAAAFGLARHSFMTTRVPLSFRARALSLLGGTFRLGMFVGPFIAAGLLFVFHSELAAIWFFGACLVATVLLVLLGPDPERLIPAEPDPDDDALMAEDTGEAVTGSIPTAALRQAQGPAGRGRGPAGRGRGPAGRGQGPAGRGRGPAGPGSQAQEQRVGVFRTMWQYRRVLSRLGLAAASLSAVRSARQVVLPLWGVSIGLDAGTIALVVGISGAIDFALFYASGQVMDRFGRLWAALPAMILMGAGFLALAFTHDVPQAELWFGVFAAVLGVGNGLSSGILLTLGADVAPKAHPAPFLGSWRTLTDAGGAVSPLLVAAITAIASLSFAVGAMGGLAFIGALAFVRWVPMFVPREVKR